MAALATWVAAAACDAAGAGESEVGVVKAVIPAARPDAPATAAPDSTTANSSGLPFLVHRVPNPRYRPPGAGAALVVPGVTSRLRALDHLNAQIFHHDPLRGGASISQWQISAGEQYRREDAIELSAAGQQVAGRSELQALRLSGRSGAFTGAVGDNPPVVLSRMADLQRLRGTVMHYEAGDAGRLLVLGGVPTPLPGAIPPRLAVAGLSLADTKFNQALVSLAMMGFGRDRVPRDPTSPVTSDTLAGRGALAALGWKVPVGHGMLAASQGAQVHDLDGPQVIAIREGVEWNMVSPSFTTMLASERATQGIRQVGTDRFAPAPTREDRWSMQARSPGGRTETHFTGVLREGGDVALETHTIGLGASGSFRRSAWYAGTDAVWDARPLATDASVLAERRFAVYAGGPMARAGAIQSRLEYGEHPHAAGTLAGSAEASLALRQGARLEFEPRLNWSEGQLQQGQVTTRLSWPLSAWGGRLTGTLALGASRQQAFRGSVSEAAISFAFAPRLRDRGQIEVRSLDPGGAPAMEYDARYDAIAERYEAPGAWLAARDTASVIVRVHRAGNGSGAPDVLVSLDGATFRFTDADGIARFDHVEPGIHTAAIEERSLQDNIVVAGSSRAFVTVERGRVADPVTFTIARAERVIKF